MKKLSILVVALLVFACSLLVSCDGTDESSSSTDVTYTIQYTDSMGNHSITVKNGDVYSLEAIPERFGYEFLGLFDLENGGTQYVSATGNSLSPFTDNKNMTLFPQFKAKEYTIILNYGEADVTGVREMKVSYGADIGVLPTNLTVPNKTFSGWFTEENKEGTQIGDKFGTLPDKKFLTEENFDLSNKNNFVYLYAGFKYQEYTLTLYIGSNATPEEIKVEWGTPISAVVPETRVDGKAVLSWSKTRNDTTLANIFTGKVEGDMILYSAELAPVIDFNPKGGNDVEPIVSRAGDTITLPTPKRDNYTFIGWFDAGNNKYEATTMPEASITLSAKWQANIVLNENGGTDVADISKPVGEAIELPTPSREGYIFAGWYQGNEKYTSTSMPENSIELTAKYWKINTKKIVLKDENGGASMETTSPDLRYSYKVDLSELYSIGVRTVNIKSNYQANVNGSSGVSSTNPIYTHMSWYSTNIASDAYKVWEYSDKHTEGSSWNNHTHNTTLNLTSDTLYVCYYATYVSWDYTKFKNFWIEIEYPDMSTLY